jgi:hypothetical protein
LISSTDIRKVSDEVPPELFAAKRELRLQKKKKKKKRNFFLAIHHSPENDSTHV